MKKRKRIENRVWDRICGRVRDRVEEKVWVRVLKGKENE